MFSVQIHPTSKMMWRQKARLNICIAKDLADSFGGDKADYLKRLNRKLRIKITYEAALYSTLFAKAA